MKLIRKIILGSIFSVCASVASAGVIFEFTVDAIGTSGGIQVGDTFFIEFYDDSNFLSGIGASDIQSVGFNSASIGADSWNVTTCSQCSNLQDIFTFTDLGSNNWQLDALVGVTGVTTSFFDIQGSRTLQLGQTESGGGPTSLFFRNASNNFANTHFYDTAHVYTSSASLAAVPETSSGILLLLGLLAIALTSKQQLVLRRATGKVLHGAVNYGLA